MLPDVLITTRPGGVRQRSPAQALAPKAEPTLGLAHLHAPQVSVRDQAATIVDRLRRTRTTTFRALVADSPDRLTTVARFLALLELFREGAVAFEQVTPLGELSVRWTGSDEGEIDVVDEYDEIGRPDEEPETAGEQDEQTEHDGQTGTHDEGTSDDRDD